MNDELILYHGSSNIVETPKFGYGKKNNDYGLGFYCTEEVELAREWASTSHKGGYVNRYILDMKELTYLDLRKMHILHWMALLVHNRSFELRGTLALEAKEYLLKEFLLDTTSYDIIMGYRADDSYFAFASSFLNGSLSLRQLSRAMDLGNLGVQIVIKSHQAFTKLGFQDYEEVEQVQYFMKRMKRDKEARIQFQEMRTEEKITDAIYMLDILRGGLTANDL